MLTIRKDAERTSLHSRPEKKKHPLIRSAETPVQEKSVKSDMHTRRWLSINEPTCYNVPAFPYPTLGRARSANFSLTVTRVSSIIGGLPMGDGYLFPGA